MAEDRNRDESTEYRGFSWLRWTVIGCAAWIVFVVATGASTIALVVTPVAGPIGGWLVGGCLFLLVGALRPGGTSG